MMPSLYPDTGLAEIEKPEGKKPDAGRSFVVVTLNIDCWVERPLMKYHQSTLLSGLAALLGNLRWTGKSRQRL